MRKGRAKVRAVDRAVSRRLGRVEVLAPRAVELDGFLVREVRQAEGDEGLAVAQDPRAASEVALLVLFNLDGERNGSDISDGTLEAVCRTILASPREVMMNRAWMRP